MEKLKSLTVSEIIEAGHQEEGWKKASYAQAYIPYDEAFSLKLV